jgi:hypothetical protein
MPSTMLIRVDPQELLDELIAALVAAECLVLRVSPGVCRALSLEETGLSGLTELRFFVNAWANSRSAAVEVRV